MGGSSALRLALLAARRSAAAGSQAGSVLLEAVEAFGGAAQPCRRGLCTMRGSVNPSAMSGRAAGSFRLGEPFAARSIHSSSATAASDYYELLGIEKGATDQDVKKAYYAQAKKYHPDTNKSDPAAATRFQELQKAYEVLRDPEKRRLYDRIGREGMDRMESGGQAEGPGAGAGPFGPGGFGAADFGAGGFGGFDFGGFRFGGDMWETIFRADPRVAAMMSRVQMPPLRLTFMEAAQGTRKTIQVQMPGGVRTITLDIPAGVDSTDAVESSIDLPGPGRRASAKMTVVFPIEIAPHPKFSRKGYDVYCTLELPLTTALLGGTMPVETLDGRVELIVPPLTQQGDHLRIRNKGIFMPHRGIKGDHYVEISVIMPKELTPRQRELLIEFEREQQNKKRAQR